MNPNLKKLQPYPFEKLKALTADVTLPNLSPIAWSVGEPKHAAPPFLSEVLNRNLLSFSNYPATAGLAELREVIARWLERRFKLPEHRISADANVIPVTGTREALFSSVQALFDPTKPNDEIWMPNPFYQIYEGAAFLAGGKPRFLNCVADNNYQPDYEAITEEQWRKCQILFICTPGNPSGATLSQAELTFLTEKAIEFNFILISDECYSELYRDELDPPAGLMEAEPRNEQRAFQNRLVFHSLSKRSNLPGLRSGFVAGDAELIKPFLAYRTYHGCAMPIPHQRVSIAAWQDEDHVIENRALYNEKFNAVVSELKHLIPVNIPEASFYLWPNLERDDEQVAKQWLEKANLRVLPGQYLSRETDGINPGYGHVRIALVATLDECLEATKRLKKIL